MAKNRIDEHSLAVLEFNAVLEVLSSFALSELGRRGALVLVPSLDDHWIRQRLAETTEFKTILEKGHRVPLGGISDVTATLDKAAGGLILECAELLAVCALLEAGNHVREFFERLDLPTPALGKLVNRLGDYESLVEEINRCVENEERLRDTASPRLAELRRSIQIGEERIRQQFCRIINSASLREAIENENLIFRQGRPTVAVKVNYRSWIRGKVLDRSKSGATLYIEPAALGEMSNELEELVYEQHKEEGRILWELSRAVSLRRGDITQTLEALGWLDLTYAKARMSLFHRQHCPEIVSGSIKLRQARHPLLVEMAASKYQQRAFGDGLADVVPIDAELGDRFDLLLLTGPNTGGKTVTLKTIGLAVLMAQSGMHINADPGSQLPVLRQVFADIGDEQSLQQSLSTFSAHMGQMVRILQGANANCLILLDEMGAGTDPAEGAALSAAMLETLQRSGAKVIATTHLGALKQFAYNNPRAENGSVEFDPTTLAPTYRLLIGEPGMSNALAITKRLGMPKAVTKRARALLGEDVAQEVDLLRKAQQFRKAAQQQQRDAEALKDEIEKIKQDTIAQRDQARHDRLALRDESDRYVDDTLQIIRRTVRQFVRLMGEAPNPWRQHAVEFWGELEKIAAQTSVAKRRAAFIKQLRSGEYVYLCKFARRAMVLRIQRKKETIVVTLDGREMEVSYEHVNPIC